MTSDPYGYGYTPPKQEVLPAGMYSRATHGHHESSAPIAPGGKITAEMMTDIAQESLGPALNRINSIIAHGDDKTALQASKEMICIAYPERDSQQQAKVIAPVQINLVVRPLNNKPEDDSVTIDSE
jgi:hypothetical protein